MESRKCGKIVAIKVFSVLTYIFTLIGVATLLAVLVNPDLLNGLFKDVPNVERVTSTVMVIYLAVMILSLCIGVYANKKLSSAKDKNSLVVVGILALLFFNLIVGILLLCITDEELRDYQGVNLAVVE